MKKILVLVFLILSLFIPPTTIASRLSGYSFIGTEYSPDTVVISVSRQLPDDNNPVVWIIVKCSDLPDQGLPVIWGFWDSPTGSVVADRGHGCIAYLTVTPWKINKNTDPKLILIDP